MRKRIKSDLKEHSSIKPTMGNLFSVDPAMYNSRLFVASGAQGLDMRWSWCGTKKEICAEFMSTDRERNHGLGLMTFCTVSWSMS